MSWSSPTRSPARLAVAPAERPLRAITMGFAPIGRLAGSSFSPPTAEKAAAVRASASTDRSTSAGPAPCSATIRDRRRADARSGVAAAGGSRQAGEAGHEASAASTSPSSSPTSRPSLLFGLWIGRGARTLADYIGRREKPPLVGRDDLDRRHRDQHGDLPLDSGLRLRPGPHLAADRRSASRSAAVAVALLLLPQYFRGEFLTSYEVLSRRFGGSTQQAASLALRRHPHARRRAPPLPHRARVCRR